MFRAKEWIMSHPYTMGYVAVVVTINLLLSVVGVVTGH